MPLTSLTFLPLLVTLSLLSELDELEELEGFEEPTAGSGGKAGSNPEEGVDETLAVGSGVRAEAAAQEDDEDEVVFKLDGLGIDEVEGIGEDVEGNREERVLTLEVHRARCVVGGFFFSFDVISNINTTVVNRPVIK